MNSLSGQSLLQHIVDSDGPAVNALLTNGIVNLDERDEVNISALSPYAWHVDTFLVYAETSGYVGNNKSETGQHR